MHQALYQMLVNEARKKNLKPIHYEDIASIAQCDLTTDGGRARISDLLDEISVFEHQNKRPLLSAIVIKKTANKNGEQEPGDGFYKLAKKLNLHQGKKSGNFFFWASEFGKVQQYWLLH